MKVLVSLVIFIMIIAFNSQCKSSSHGAIFCDTACTKDTLKFTNENHLAKPYVYVSFKDCNADSILWSYRGMGVNRKYELPAIRLSKNFVRCIIADTTTAWFLFNDCSTGRGYFMKMNYGKNVKSVGTMNPRAINNIDPKFAITEDLSAYTDKGNIFIEDMKTGKKAMMTFGEQLEFDFDNIHQTLDSVNVSPTRIWAKVKLASGWKELEKNITLE